MAMRDGNGLHWLLRLSSLATLIAVLDAGAAFGAELRPEQVRSKLEDDGLSATLSWLYSDQDRWDEFLSLVEDGEES